MYVFQHLSYNIGELLALLQFANKFNKTMNKMTKIRFLVFSYMYCVHHR